MSEKRITQISQALRDLDGSAAIVCIALVERYGSQRAAAKAIGISTVHFNRMKRGHAKPSLEMLQQMCAAAVFGGEADG